MKVQFFYNYDVNKAGEYNKFNYGISTVNNCDSYEQAVDLAMNEIKKEARELYPNYDNLNIKAFNRL